MEAGINFADAVKDLERINTKEIPFASAMGINDTAFKARKTISNNIPKKFDLKSKWIARGVRVQKANKKDLVIKATVYHIDDYMEDHEDGGKRKPTSGKSKMPVKDKKFRGRAARVNKKKYASELLKDYKGPRSAGKLGGRGKKRKGTTKYFFVEGQKHDFIARRQRRSKGYRNKFHFAYRYAKDTNYTKRLAFKKTVIGISKNVGPKLIAKQLNKLS